MPAVWFLTRTLLPSMTRRSSQNQRTAATSTRCSAERTRAASVASSSSSCTATAQLDAVGEGAAVRVQARVRRQERGMNVEQAAAIARDEVRSHDAHESSEDDEIGSKSI